MIKRIHIKVLAINIKKFQTVVTLLLLLSVQTALAECFDKVGVPLTAPTSDFQFSPSDPIVIHKKTELMWQRCPVGYDFSAGICKVSDSSKQTFIWEDALTLANRESYAGFSGWRLPNIKELISISEDGCIPNLNLEVFPFENFFENPNTETFNFWSSSPSSVILGSGVRAYASSFFNGATPAVTLVNSLRSVLLVRDTTVDFVNTMAPAFQHPRCQNCHAVAATNFVSGGDSNGVGLPQGHQPISASSTEEVCMMCHSSDILPEAELEINWHAAPVTNDFRNLSLTELCEKAQDGGEQASGNPHLHMTEDPLVIWAFNPLRPGGFSSFESAPPYSIEAWRDIIDVWRDEGFPCPTE